MFKVGSEIKCISFTAYSFTRIGKIYKIIELDNLDKTIVRIINDNGSPWWVLKKDFQSIRKEINNDIEWLDAIQQNFKEGV